MACFHIFYLFIDIFILFVCCSLISLSIFETVVLKSLSNMSNAQASSEMNSINLFCSIEYYSVITLEIRFTPFSRAWWFLFCCFLKTVRVHLFNDFPKLFLQRLYQLLCVVNEISVPLAFVQLVFWLRFFSTSISLKQWTKKIVFVVQKFLIMILQICSVLGHFNT